MKNFILAILIVLFPVVVWAQQCVEPVEVARLSPAIVGGSVPAGAPTGCAAYLICQGFEGAGYDNSESWTEVNQGGATINEDYTDVSPEGDQALSVISGADNDTDDGTWESFTAQSHVYGYFILYTWSHGTTAANFFIVQNASGTQIFAIYAYTDQELRVWDGSEKTSSYILDVETEYHIWWEYQTGSGTGIIKVYVATSATKPESPQISVTNGTYTDDAARIFVATRRQGSHVYDKIRVKTTDIGSTPD